MHNGHYDDDQALKVAIELSKFDSQPQTGLHSSHIIVEDPVSARQHVSQQNFCTNQHHYQQQQQPVSHLMPNWQNQTKLLNNNLSIAGGEQMQNYSNSAADVEPSQILAATNPIPSMATPQSSTPQINNQVIPTFPTFFTIFPPMISPLAQPVMMSFK